MKVMKNTCLSALLLCFLAVGTSAHAQSLSPTASTTAFVFTRDLTAGMSGADVSALQQFLIDHSFLSIVIPTGYFGLLTQTALAAWQASVGISPSAGFFGPDSRQKISSAVPQTTSGTASTQSNAGTAAAQDAAAVIEGNGSPMRLVIPTIGVVAGYQFLGLKPDGSMEVPNNIIDAGWYTGSPKPGEVGDAVLTGHIAQIRNSVLTKQGVFYQLHSLQPGDTIYALNDRGEVTTFIVRTSRLYDPAASATDVFISTDGKAHLNLITCEGTWNQEQLSYSQRLVVFADAVSP